MKTVMFRLYYNAACVLYVVTYCYRSVEVTQVENLQQQQYKTSGFKSIEYLSSGENEMPHNIHNVSHTAIIWSGTCSQ